jgi:hypothetical protein
MFECGSTRSERAKSTRSIQGSWSLLTSTDDSKKTNGWTADDFKGLMEAGKLLLEEWIQYQKERDAAILNRLNAVSKHNRRLSYSLILFLLAIVGGMGALTYIGKVSGDALLFLVGTVTGYVVLMIQDLTQPLYEPIGTGET